MSNMDKEIIDVYWSRLRPVLRDEKSYKRECPFCVNGLFLVGRDREKNMELAELDGCIGCGQRVLYLDIESLRDRER